MTIESKATHLHGCRNTRIYCLPDCPAGRRTKPENRVYFRSREEAWASGYRACKVCKPDILYGEPETFFLTSYNSPLGTYILVSSQFGVVCLEPEDGANARLRRWQQAGIQLQGGDAQNSAAASELDAYFSGQLHQFRVSLDLRGTLFQRQVWEKLRDIPYGETRSYGDIARALGRPTAVRAVGGANGSNPISIIVPCHRVIGANGTLVGYGGGLDRKQVLLDLEAAALRKKIV